LGTRNNPNGPATFCRQASTNAFQVSWAEYRGGKPLPEITADRLTQMTTLFGQKNSFVAVVAVFVAFLVTACRTTQTTDAARIHSQKSSELVIWLDWGQMPEDLKDRDPFFVEAICDELVARREVGFLLASLDASTNEDVRTCLVSCVLYHIDDARIYNAFAQRLTDKEDEESYYVASYLAKKGNTNALATLNRHYFQYPVSSWQWSYTVEIFGKFRYIPAATNLVESLDAASLNVSAAACNALHKFYPDSPSHFSGPAQAREYYIKRLGEAPH
jgi:hypothetical protein